MKILLANKFFFLNGGSETVFFQERKFLKGNGESVIDFSMQDERNFPSEFSEYFVPNIDYRQEAGLFGKLRTAGEFIHSREALKRLESLVDQEGPQIAHLHNIYHQLTPSIIPLLKKKKVKVIMTLHDGKMVCPAYLMLNRDKICVLCEGKHFYKPVTTRCQGSISKELLFSAEAYWHKWRRSYDQVDLFLTPSSFLADLVSRYRFSIEKIRVLRNGIDIQACEPSDQDRGYAIYFGRLSREKGVETLLRAHAQTKEHIPLKVVGTGPLEKEWRLRYPDVEFMGYRTGKELREIVGNASFVVVPSEWNENCSMVVLEAMALARPVIGSKIGGIPEQVEHGVTGFLFEMGNVAELCERMLALWSDRELRHSMGLAARRKLEKEYSLRKHLYELLKIYNEVLGNV